MKVSKFSSKWISYKSFAIIVLCQVTKDYFTDTVLSKQKELEKLEASEPGKSFATFFGKSPAQVKEEKMGKLKNDITNLSANGEVS